MSYRVNDCCSLGWIIQDARITCEKDNKNGIICPLVPPTLLRDDNRAAWTDAYLKRRKELAIEMLQRLAKDLRSNAIHVGEMR